MIEAPTLSEKEIRDSIRCYAACFVMDDDYDTDSDSPDITPPNSGSAGTSSDPIDLTID